MQKWLKDMGWVLILSAVMVSHFSPVLNSWHRASAEVIFLYGQIKDDSLSG